MFSSWLPQALYRQLLSLGIATGGLVDGHSNGFRNGMDRWGRGKWASEWIKWINHRPFSPPQEGCLQSASWPAWEKTFWPPASPLHHPPAPCLNSQTSTLTRHKTWQTSTLTRHQIWQTSTPPSKYRLPRIPVVIIVARGVQFMKLKDKKIWQFETERAIYWKLFRLQTNEYVVCRLNSNTKSNSFLSSP